MSRRKRRFETAPIKPFGFCCKLEAQPDSLKRIRMIGPKKKSSFASMHSLHDCAALWIREQILEPRTRASEVNDDDQSKHNMLRGLQSKNSGLMNQIPKGLTESQRSLMMDFLRKKKQEQYEKNLTRWAKLGAQKDKRPKPKQRTCKSPCWYTDLSQEQLNLLGSLEDMMFRDKEENVTSRTLNTLIAVGILQDLTKVKPSLIRKLLVDYSFNSVKFLCEIYKAVTGNDFRPEENKLFYRSNERIILSAITFLELPKVLMQLHRRLPPVQKFQLPKKPTYPVQKIHKKSRCPYLEKYFVLPLNWRLYKKNLYHWRNKLLSLPRPIAVFPKEKAIQRTSEDLKRLFLETDTEKENNKLITENETYANHDITEDDFKNEISNFISEPSSTQVTINFSETFQPSDVEEKSIKKNRNKSIENFESKIIGVSEKIRDEQSQLNSEPNFEPDQILKNWTKPLTMCPYKYRKLMNKVGPLQDDDEFFSELKPDKCQKCYPPGRENLSLNMQNMLLNFEEDFNQLSHKADNITSKVCEIYKEVFHAAAVCDPCCSCRQTRKSHLLRHATKSPQRVIDSVFTDELNNTQVIGSLAMQSPAASIPSINASPVVPSKDKLKKNFFISGTTTNADGCPIHQIDGVVKILEHIPSEVLHPETDLKERRQVYPCNCRKEKPSAPDLFPGVDEDLCYGQKFRKEEIPNYHCKDFDTKNKKICIKDEFKCEKSFPYEIPESFGENFSVETTNSIKTISLFSTYISEAEQCDFSSKNSCSYNSNELDDRNDANKESNRICKKCQKKMDMKCNLLSPQKNGFQKLKKIEYFSRCECDSMSDFLQMDLSKFEYNKLKDKSHKKKRLKNRFISAEKIKITVSTESCNFENNKSDFAESTISNKINSQESIQKSPICDPKSKICDKINKDLKNEDTKEKSLAESVKRRCGKGRVKSCKDRQSFKCYFEKNSFKTIEEEENIEKSDNNELMCGRGPFGHRTKSEAALPVAKTIAYLTDLHPPNYKAEMIPVRKGGRPCSCRENRNNQKTIKYAISGLAPGASDDKVHSKSLIKLKQESPKPVIEGVFWLTPEPSVRGSNEYITEYELYDSSYVKGTCQERKCREKINKCFPEMRMKGGADCPDKSPKNMRDDNKKTEKIEEIEHSVGTDNAIKDPFLTEFFTKKYEKFSCCAKSGTEAKKEIKKLKVAKPVCECKNERRIVENKENKQKWADRQNYLKSLEKETYLQVSGFSKPNCDDEPEDLHCLLYPERTELLVTGVTVQTPFATPTPSRTVFGNLPYVPESPSLEKLFKSIVSKVNVEKDVTSLSKSSKSENKMLEGKQQKSSKIKKSSISNEETSKDTVPCCDVNKENLNKDIEKSMHTEIKAEKLENQDNEIHPKELATSESKVQLIKTPTPSKFFKKPKKINALFEQKEAMLLDMIQGELIDMIHEEEFVSIKLHDYYKIPQILYWISYRVRGKNYSNQMKRKLMRETINKWIVIDKNTRWTMHADVLEIKPKERRLCNFNYIKYWKCRGKKMKEDFYLRLKNDILDLGHEMWGTMEYGKFPNVNFKQAYFTYMPAKENDVYVLAP